MNWWTRWIRRDHVEAQLEAELRDHFERLVVDFRHEGLTEDKARRRARLEFGGVEQVKELCRDARGTRWIEEVTQDIRYGCRGFRRNPGFTLVAVMTLALGVGATMAIFNLVDALFLRAARAARRGISHADSRHAGNSSEHFSYPQVRQLAEQQELRAARVDPILSLWAE